ncbi:MAG TPA: LytTR family DNA-binding domain-containing protein [Cytophagales bacterium]|nr:LytTR family DNA-binding domain-containing protein [Cytophagales bacterium]
MKKQKNCVVVDDEPIARAIVTSYIEQIPNLTIIKQCKDAFEAMEALEEGNADLLFLDINMPKLSGLSMLRTLANPPQVIITTAYPEFAIEGFELSVVDYLLKPFSFERFVQAVRKASKSTLIEKTEEITKKNPDFIFVKADQKLVRVMLDEIQFIEAYGNYIKIHVHGSWIISKQTLTQFEEELPSDTFIRIHKSYIVPLPRIDYLEGNQVLVAGKFLPVGKAHRNILINKLSKS